MSTSFTQHTGDEGVRSYLAPQEYIDNYHVKAFVDSVEVTQSDALTPTTFILEDISGSIYATFGSAITLQGFTIDLKRVTPETSIINFVNGTTNQASDFNTSFQQSSYIAIEVREQASVFGGSAIYYSKTEADGRFTRLVDTTNVDNTSDLDKPVSTAQQSALDLKADQSAVDAAIDAIIPSPTGSVTYYASSTIPTGWLRANGAEVSRTTYADLYAVIGETYGAGDGSTTFELPDLRGEFVRGFDDGRGVDTGRVLGSAQQDEFGEHRHLTVANGTGGDAITSPDQAVRARRANSNDLDYSLVTSTDEPSVGKSSLSGGSETRPRNIALLAIIKY